MSINLQSLFKWSLNFTFFAKVIRPEFRRLSKDRKIRKFKCSFLTVVKNWAKILLKKPLKDIIKDSRKACKSIGLIWSHQLSNRNLPTQLQIINFYLRWYILHNISTFLAFSLNYNNHYNNIFSYFFVYIIFLLCPIFPWVISVCFLLCPIFPLVLVYELNGWGFECRFCHLNVRYAACIEQGVHWYSGKL